VARVVKTLLLSRSFARPADGTGVHVMRKEPLRISVDAEAHASQDTFVVSPQLSSSRHRQTRPGNGQLEVSFEGAGAKVLEVGSKRAGEGRVPSGSAPVGQTGPSQHGVPAVVLREASSPNASLAHLAAPLASSFDGEVRRRLEAGALLQRWARALAGAHWRPLVRGARTPTACAGLLAVLVICGCLSARHLLSDASQGPFIGTWTNGEKTARVSADVADFLEVFNHVPQTVRFRLVGCEPNAAGIGRYMRWLSRQSVHVFDVSLDLTPFVSNKAHMSKEHEDSMQQFLATENMLETLTIHKTITWEGWEDVTKRVRRRLQELGFAGKLDAFLICGEKIFIHYNDPWSKFVRSWATQMILGILVIPYMRVRTKHRSIESHFVINIDPAHYWDLISIGISAEHGFQVR